jgi:hypothetical protein
MNFEIKVAIFVIVKDISLCFCFNGPTKVMENLALESGHFGSEHTLRVWTRSTRAMKEHKSKRLGTGVVVW